MDRTGRHLALLLLLAVVLLGGCTDASYDDASYIVEVTQLQELMDQQDVVVIDARSAEEYAKGHLDGAVHLSAADVSSDEPVPSTLADRQSVEEALGARGITPDSRIVLYDDSGGVFSARVWWVLKVYGHEDARVVNGGADAIVKEGLALSTETPAVERTTYDAQEADASLLATYEMVNAQVENPAEEVKILDVRSTAEFAEGAIPGAILYPHTNNYYPDGTFKSRRTIELDYGDLGLEKSDTLYIYCKSSFRATPTAMLLMEAGYQNVKVYDGAWLEWEQKGTVEETEEPVLTEQDAS